MNEGLVDGYIGWLRSHVGHAKIQMVAAVGCVVHNGAVLLQRRSDTGGWGWPGGAVELGETAHDAAVREVREETGIDVTVTHLIGVYTGYESRYPNGDLTQPIVIAFHATPRQPGAPLADPSAETLEARYFNLAEVPELTFRQHRDILADLQAGRQGVFR